jgi:hypothetical protein
MCEKTVSKKIYQCGDTEEQDVTFSPCNDQDKEGHTVKIIPLASKRVKESVESTTALTLNLL